MVSTLMCRNAYKSSMHKKMESLCTRGSHSNMDRSHSCDRASWPHTLRKGWSHFAFFHVLLGQRTKCACSQRSLTDFQYSQLRAICSAVKQSSTKSDGQTFLTLILAVNMMHMALEVGTKQTPPSTLHSSLTNFSLDPCSSWPSH